MRFTVPTIVSMMAAVLLTGCSLFPQGPDQAERDRWSRVIETAIEALPAVADASHTFQYHPYGPNSYYTSRLDVRLEDGATPAETASVVRAMGAQLLPPHYRGDSTMFKIHRMTDSFSGDWRPFLTEVSVLDPPDAAGRTWTSRYSRPSERNSAPRRQRNSPTGTFVTWPDPAQSSITRS
ncbi:hypothetical protein [Nocardia salmonicida]|uniref:hypothetical protein n=1 Tax=Nocardia salmonicida TaxID=53431 RepID=UPI002E2CDF06|nr:hypothetical protein [Nocardia salmonicida]